jgi:hypothetical protein
VSLSLLGVVLQVQENQTDNPLGASLKAFQAARPFLRGNEIFAAPRRSKPILNYSAFAAEVTLIVSPSSAPSSTTLSPINDFTFSAPSSLNTFLSLS